MRSHIFTDWNLLFKCFVLFVAIISTIKAIEADNHFLKRYTKISFNKHELTESHNRAKRSIDNRIRLTFDSHGKTFNLELKKSETNIDKDLIHFADGASSSQHDLTIYEGHLVDEPKDSYVSGTILDGSFIGTIRSKAHGNFYVEPTKRFEDSDDSHAVVYHEEDIQMRNNVGCGLSFDHVQEELAKQQNNFVQIKERKNKKISSQKDDHEVKVETRSYKYSQVANSQKERREKRQSASQLPFPDQRSVCSLYLRIDPYLYDYILKREGNNDAKLTENYLLFYLNEQVASLNAIFSSIRFFNGSNFYSGVEFKINRIKIFKLSDCSGSTLNEAEKNLCINFLDSTTLLNYISLDDFENYCLSFTFTSRDFSDGTLGLAWLASNTGAAGGVCQDRVSVQGVEKSLNSGLVTLVNYNSRIPARVNQITFVHEVGHTFGSSHDNSTCTPGNSGGGNYIMYSRATTATLPNNDDFSPCSLDKMSKVFTYVLQNKFCFQRASQSICGNRIVEPGEECDCGFLNECDDRCCNSTTCRLNLGAQCSPSQGPCCNSTCQYHPANKICQKNNDCLQDVFCSGTNYTCPRGDSSFFKPDNTTCNSGTQLCRNGTCQGSICEVYSMQQCYLEGDLSDSNVDKASLCNLACTGARTNFQCVDTAEISGFGGPDRKGYTLRPGSPCAGTQGYCDVFGKCRSVNSEGVLSKLLETLTTPQEITIEDVKRWVQKYWWAILIFCIIFMIFNGLILACIIIHMRSDNPEKKTSRSFLDTLKAPVRLFSRNRKSQSQKADNKRRDSKNPRIIPKFDHVNMGPKEVIPISTFSKNNRSNSRSDRRATPDYNSDE